MIPSRPPRYRSALFDSARWSDVDLRSGDIVVSTPPKSGTTWTLAMVYLSLHGPDARFERLSSAAPWVDFHGGRPDAPPRQARSFDGRRIFKTHTPLDGVPLVDGVVAITVHRDPGESLLSMRRHLRNMTAPAPDHPNRGPLEMALETFLSRPLDLDHFDGVTLSGLHHHLRRSEQASAARFHYSEMSADPVAALRAIAGCIGAPLDPASERAIIDATGKAAMRRNAGTYTPEANTGLFKDDARFFAGGDERAERLTDAQRSRIFDRVHSDMGDHSAAWLCRTAGA
ncbi:sulfotransferase domain-containing protein [Albimonas sp. CAU 1670]|uniref:sulfotransferase domain-containing protein n=1 Tax=Albimonas sp. CAU 1670 TaxID=3032599 RepID=UPI0023D9EAE0|nr:sulfotransferase domain-containing protein [Albimonas sp. CAU 1670]MDF2235798.1 sulfotransferase domain-containing protein [Albimonas sp. CAU 1670]